MKIRIKTTNRVVPRSRHLLGVGGFEYSSAGESDELVTDITVPTYNKYQEMWFGSGMWPAYKQAKPDDWNDIDWSPGDWWKLGGDKPMHFTKPKQPLHKRLTKLFKRRNK